MQRQQYNLLRFYPFLKVDLTCSDLTREDLQELWRYTMSVPPTSELQPNDLPQGEVFEPQHALRQH